MKSATTFLLLIGVVTMAQASEPGQPLDCSDWVLLDPGLSCSVWVDCPPDAEPTDQAPCMGAGSVSAFDNEARLLRVLVTDIGPCGDRTLRRHELRALDGVSWAILAYLDDRCFSSGRADGLHRMEMEFDSIGGRLALSMHGGCFVGGGIACDNYNDKWTLAVIDGLTPLFEISQQYTPSGSLTFRVPALPEGLEAADHFDTYWGPLGHPTDFTQAMGLRCQYPAPIPEPGDHLEVPDTLPDPAVGEGYYYVTAVTHLETRYGRRSEDGQLSGRDPSRLPSCVEGVPSSDSLANAGAASTSAGGAGADVRASR